jgi:hypothetical protein
LTSTAPTKLVKTFRYVLLLAQPASSAHQQVPIAKMIVFYAYKASTVTHQASSLLPENVNLASSASKEVIDQVPMSTGNVRLIITVLQALWWNSHASRDFIQIAHSKALVLHALQASTVRVAVTRCLVPKATTASKDLALRLQTQ